MKGFVYVLLLAWLGCGVLGMAAAYAYQGQALALAVGSAWCAITALFALAAVIIRL